MVAPRCRAPGVSEDRACQNFLQPSSGSRPARSRLAGSSTRPGSRCFGDAGHRRISTCRPEDARGLSAQPLGRWSDDNESAGDQLPVTTPTGTVDFSVDGAGLATAELVPDDDGEWSWSRTVPVTYSGTPTGAHTFGAEYNGNFDSPTRFSEEYSIAPALTTTQLQQSAASTVAGQPITFTATVSDRGDDLPRRHRRPPGHSSTRHIARQEDLSSNRLLQRTWSGA